MLHLGPPRRYFFFEELFEERDFEPPLAFDDLLLPEDFEDFEDLLDFEERPFEDFEDDLRGGTLSPSRRASEIPMATACF